MATKATEDERKFILLYRSVSFFTGFVECQEQELQQQNGKKNEQYDHLLRKCRERFPDADNHLIKKFNSLPTNFRK